MRNIQPNQLGMHPFFMHDGELARRQFEDVDFARQNRLARKAVMRTGAWLFCLCAGMGVLAHLHNRASTSSVQSTVHG